MQIHPNAKDLTGQRFGRLTAIKPTDKRSGRGIVWECLCDCKNKCFVNGSNLRTGNTKSCGCLIIDKIVKRNFRHGMSDTSIYNIWKLMLRRCKNSNVPEWKYYGGRGIKVCERWHKFENFYEDVGVRPKGKSLDRWPDNNGDYEPSNCRWATRREQRTNSRPTSCGHSRQYWFFAYNTKTGEWDEDNNQHDFAKRHKMNRWTVGECVRGQQAQHREWIFNILR